MNDRTTSREDGVTVREGDVTLREDCVIRLEDCWKTYYQGSSETHAVQNVSLEVHRGEFAAITGRSGSGKSTLLNLMGALDTPTRGAVEVLGKNLAGLSDDQLAAVRRRDVSTVFQAYNLLPTLTVRENVELPAHLLSRRPADIESDVAALLESVGLAEHADDWPDSLSGGEAQRVAIARALVNHPAAVLADEPTGNLDSANAENILSLLRQLCEIRGAAIVMVTHSAEAAARADRIITMRDGRIVSAEA